MKYIITLITLIFLVGCKDNITSFEEDQLKRPQQNYDETHGYSGMWVQNKDTLFIEHRVNPLNGEDYLTGKANWAGGNWELFGSVKEDRIYMKLVSEVEFFTSFTIQNSWIFGVYNGKLSNIDGMLFVYKGG